MPAPVPSLTVRPADAADARGLARLAQLDSARPLTGAILLAEEDGVPVAARFLADGRTIANPFRATTPAETALEARARALGALAPAPSLRERLAAALAPLRLTAAAA